MRRKHFIEARRSHRDPSALLVFCHDTPRIYHHRGGEGECILTKAGSDFSARNGRACRFGRHADSWYRLHATSR